MENSPTLPVTTEKEPFNFMDYLQFKRMVTLQVIPVLYAIVAIFISLAGLRMLFLGSGRGYGGYGASDFFDGAGAIGGLLFLTVGNVIWRMWCELILVLFRVNKNLQNIDKNTRDNKISSN